ncbi:Glutamate 5-kinase [uncultured archaeon]|nr:Glutamate 5-kinase [uncultured archaeon]
MDVSEYSLIAVKIGTNAIMREGVLDKEFLDALVSEVALLSRAKKKVVLISSGAVGMGKKKIKFSSPNGTTIKEQQGLAAIGQIELMNEYLGRFERKGVVGAQVLVSQHDFLNKQCLLNIKSTFDFLFERGIVPIVNENDVVATEELRVNGVFSDNDALAALLAKQIGAGLLVFITAKGGLIGRDGKIIDTLTKMEQVCVLNEKSKDGRGGIDSKLSAIKTALGAGCDVFVSGPKGFNGFAKGKAEGTFALAISNI